MAKRNTTKYMSNKQEKRVAKSLNAKVTVASGALSFQKADVRSDLFLVECKTTEKSYYPLTRKTWDRISIQAIRDGIRMPLMCIDLEDGKYSIAVINYMDFIGLDLDLKAQYLGNPLPDLIENDSFRVSSAFIGSPFPQDLQKGQYPCYRRDVKFIGGDHLVLIPMEDFINLTK